MAADPRTVNAPPPVHCPQCGGEAIPLEDGSCQFCALESARESEATRRRQAREADRAALGLQPLARATSWTRIAIDAGLYWCDWAARFADGDGAKRLDRVRTHLATARQLIGGRSPINGGL